MTPQIQSATLCDPKFFLSIWISCYKEKRDVKEKGKGLFFRFGGNKLCWGFRHATTPLESSVYGERSEGATIQLTTCGVCPKLSESQCVPPQSCMHKPRGPCCAAASERPPVTTRHLWGYSVLSSVLCVCMHLCVWTVCSWVYMCIHLGSIFIKSIHVFVSPCESRAGLWFMERLPNCPVR